MNTRYRQQTNTSYLVLSSIASLIATACTGSIDAGTDELPPTASMSQLGTVDITPEARVEFYELAPGQLLTTISAPASSATLSQMLPHVDTTSLRPSDFYQLFAPDREIPDQLVEAEERAGFDAPPTDLTVAQEDLVAFRAQPKLYRAQTEYCDTNWFISNFCLQGEDDWCQVNMTSLRTSRSTNVSDFRTAVCANIGDVTLSIRGSKIGQWSVAQGTVRQFWWHCPSFFPDVCEAGAFEASVTGVEEGDAFHFAGVVVYD